MKYTPSIEFLRKTLSQSLWERELIERRGQLTPIPHLLGPKALDWAKPSDCEQNKNMEA
jgi:hypothetical protein